MILALGEREPVIEGEGHFIAATASVIGSVRLRSQSSVWFGSVLRGDNDWIDIGERSNIQDHSVLHTDPGIELIVGNDVTVGHRVMLHGCRVGDNSLVGIGSTVLNGATIGSHCVVGAHSLITENKAFPDGSLIMGAPAKVARPLTNDEFDMLARLADVYVVNAKRFNEQLRELPD